MFTRSIGRGLVNWVMTGGSSIYDRLVDSLWRPDGPKPEEKRRPVHTIGTGASGFFAASDNAAHFCTAEHFQKGRTVPVSVRFSNGSGNATRHDGWSDLRGMATRFHLDDDRQAGVAADLLAITVPGFFTPTVDEFLDFAKWALPQPYLRQSPWYKFVKLLNLEQPRRNPYPRETISPDIGAEAFADRYDNTKLPVFLDASIGAPASFARAPYHAVHSFIVTGSDGARRHVRFNWQPTLGVLNKDPQQPPEDVYLEHELRERLAAGPASFSLMMAIGEGGDDFNDSSRAWSFQRRRVFMGTMTIDRYADDQWTDNEHMSFNPCRLVDGIEPSDDPILHARRHLYEVSRLRRGAPLCPFARS